MQTELERFTRQLHDVWLPAFCSDEKRKFDPVGFKDASIRLAEFDASNFLRAIKSGLVRDRGGGRYQSKRSSAQEQIFWEGLKSVEPRPLTLWLEPVITMGTIARLSLDFGWPPDVLGMQSKDWAFDFVVYESPSSKKKHVSGEVKTTAIQCDNLIADLHAYGKTGASEPLSGHLRHKNSFKKWQSLLNGRAKLLWVVGPDNYTHLFEVQYGPDKKAHFLKTTLDRLQSGCASCNGTVSSAN